MTALPDVYTLYVDQRQGWTCVRCRRRLYRNVHIGTVTHYGHLVDLWVCPDCATPEEQAAQDAGAMCARCGRWATNAAVIPVGERGGEYYVHPGVCPSVGGEG